MWSWSRLACWPFWDSGGEISKRDGLLVTKLQQRLRQEIAGRTYLLFFLEETDWGKEIQRSSDVLNWEMLWSEKTPLWWRPVRVSDWDSKELLWHGVRIQRITKCLRHTSDLSVLEGFLCGLSWNGCWACKNWECLDVVYQAWDGEAVVLMTSLIPTKILHVVWNKWPQCK